MIKLKKVLRICLLMILFFSGALMAQESQIAKKSVSKTYDLNGLKPSLIFSRAETWFTNEVNGENNVIESVDPESKELLVKGETKVLYKNIGKELYPKRSGMAEVLDAYFGHLIEIKVGEDSYTITYAVTDMRKEMYGKEDVFFDCINFIEVDKDALKNYNDDMNKLLKANLVFKKRRDIFLENSPAQFEEVNTFLLSEGETNIFSLNETVVGN
ncbi:DUF4468 domain-containing protein [Lutimonas sp.]|uniref:DUF4468 domain-containing protein n=1 Tax=Lutimonas sp. TaxID=1872403 RepID=UPI003D9BC729